MKTKFLSNIVMLLLFFTALVGCKKEHSLKINQPIEPVSEFKKLKPEHSFNWTNERIINFEVIPFSTPTSISNTLNIYINDKSEIVYTAQIEMGKSFSTKITVPANTDEITIRYGSIEQTVPIIENQIKFDFVTFDIIE